MLTLPFFSTFNNPIHTDIHSHLLPGIDDGVKTIDDSLVIAKEFAKLGYTKIITTPHVMGDIYPNTTETILIKLESVQKALVNEGISINIIASAEYYLDNHFLEILKKDKLLPFGKKYLLFETNYQSKPMIFDKAIFEMQSKGYIPVLAHPERYLYLHEDIDRYHELKELGILFQVNVKSIKSHSSTVNKHFHKLINHGLVDFVGSDVHRIKEIQDFGKLIRHKHYREIIHKNTLLNNLL